MSVIHRVGVTGNYKINYDRNHKYSKWRITFAIPREPILKIIVRHVRSKDILNNLLEDSILKYYIILKIFFSKELLNRILGVWDICLINRTQGGTELIAIT